MYEEKITNDILFEIDMQLYNEFNDKLCEMNEHIGDIYSLREIEEIEQAEKEKERKLLREAIRKLQKENEEQKKSYDKLFNGYNERVQEIIELEKENEKLKNIKNKAVGYINCCKTSLGNYLLSPSEVEYLLDILKEGDIE